MKLRLLLLVAAVGAGPAPAQEVFKLRIPLPLTGIASNFARMEKQAYELAESEINAKGGAGRWRLAFEFLDNSHEPEGSTAMVEKLVTQEKQPLILGENTSQWDQSVARLAERSKVPYLIVIGAADKITQQGARYVFRLNPPASLYNDGVLSFFDQVAHPKTIAILYENADFGTSTSRAMKEACEARGIQVLLNLPVTERFQTVSPDFRPVLQKVKAANPDVVYVVAYLANATLLIKQARELDVHPKAFVGAGAGFSAPEFVQNAGPASELVFSGALWTPQVKYPGGRAFHDKFLAKYGKEPGYHAAEAYAAAYVVADALRRTRSTSPEDLRDALAATDLMTAFGPVKFISWGPFTNQNRLDTLVVQVIKGRFETVWPKEAASAPAVYPVPKWKDRK